MFVDRCTKAILHLLEQESVKWPDATTQKDIARQTQEKYGTPNCISFMDGTIFPLEFKPTLFGEEYHNWKGRYASMHDNHVWVQSEQCARYNDLLLFYNICWLILLLLQVHTVFLLLRCAWCLYFVC